MCVCVQRNVHVVYKHGSLVSGIAIWCFSNESSGKTLFNDALNTFYLRLYGVAHMVKDHSVREETRCRQMGYSFRLTARVLLYAPSHRQDNTHHNLCYTSHDALAGTINSSMGPPHEGSNRRPIVPRVSPRGVMGRLIDPTWTY